MGVHAIDTPVQSGLGRKVESFIHGLGAFKTAYGVGGILLGAARTLGPMAANVGRAALPLMSAAI